MSDRARKGSRGEKLAALFLMCKGYRILARRLRLRQGEIDLLAQRGSTLVVVEVKWRNTYERAAYALQPTQQRRLRQAGEALFAKRARWHRCTMLRFDVILITPPLSFRHLIDAF